MVQTKRNQESEKCGSCSSSSDQQRASWMNANVKVKNKRAKGGDAIMTDFWIRAL